MPPTASVSQNIQNLYAAKRNPSLSSVPSIAAKRKPAQIAAIAESEARKMGGGNPVPKRSFPHPFNT
jgi:hypothetical protein